MSCLLAIAADPPADSSGALKKDANLPGSFLPYNVTGPYKGRFHCLISDYGLESGVLVFVRDLELTDSAKDLLKQLDERIEKNPSARLHAFVVFLSGEFPGAADILANDDKREELAGRLESVASGLMLKHVVLCLDSPKDVEKYALGDSWATVVLYSKYRVVSVNSLTKGDAKAEVDKILTEIGEKLKAAKAK